MKKILIFLIILISTFSVLYILPIFAVLDIQNREISFTFSNSEYNQRLGNVIESNVDKTYIQDTVWLVTKARQFQIYDRDKLHELLLYFYLVINLSLITTSILLIKNKKNIFVGKSLLVTSILSSAFSFYFVFTLITSSLH